MKNKIIFITLMLACIVYGQSSLVDSTKPITIDTNGIANYIAWEGSPITARFKDVVNDGVLTNGWADWYTNEVNAVRIPSVELIQRAALFKATLRKHFDVGAETNKTITVNTVEIYFETKRVMGTITSLETADAIALTKYFELISKWTGDGTTWSFPWHYVP